MAKPEQYRCCVETISVSPADSTDHMYSIEPARKKAKPTPDVDLLQGNAKPLVKPVDVILRDSSNASHTCELAEATTIAVAVVEFQRFRVFVLDIESHLFVTGQLWLKVPLLCYLLPTNLWCYLCV